MESIKCPECGLVNWSTSAECRRCGALIAADPQQRPARYAIVKEVRVEPLFSTGIKLLSLMLALTTVICLVQQVVQPLSTDMAKEIAVYLALPALGLFGIAHIWLLFRIFEQSVGWGVAAFLFPLALLFAVANFWHETKRSFVGQCICLTTFFVALAIGA